MLRNNLCALCAAGMDYVGGSFPITIVPMFAPVCVNISILSDTLVEDVERFSLRLTSDAQVVSAFGFSVVSIAGETGECECVCVCVCVCECECECVCVSVIVSVCECV